MSARVRIPVIDDALGGLHWRGVVNDVRSRMSWRVAAVCIALIASKMLLEWLGTLDVLNLGVDEMPSEFWVSILLIETLLATTLVLGVLVADALVDRGASRVLVYAVTIVAATALAAWLQWIFRSMLDLRVMSSMPGVPHDVSVTQPLLVFLEAGVSNALLMFVYVNRRTTLRALSRMYDAQLARAQTQRQTFESKLQAMQARVEPQFLFNTLAQVKKLYESDSTLGGTVLDDLIAYLRAALPHLRQSTSTLGKEVDLARAYLAIMQARLGDRLAFRFDVPTSIRDARMPPMVLLPLIDHALVYGLAPAREGGELHIATEIRGAMLELSISDTGAGFVPGGGAHSLDPIADRLRALYGDEATLKLAAMQDRGTRAILTLPYEPQREIRANALSPQLPPEPDIEVSP